MTFLSFGQTKENLVSALELVFSHQEFEPAFHNDLTTDGSIILKTKYPTSSISRNPQYNLILQNLVQADFFDSTHRIKVIREEDFEFSGIPLFSVLNIRGEGNNETIRLTLLTTITHEKMLYTWNYILNKDQDDNWKIENHTLHKRNAQVGVR